MSRTVFILGAGASRQAGGPLMSDFLDKARQLHRAGRTKEKAAFDLVFKAISSLDAVHAKAVVDTNNFEQVFGLFEMASLCGRLGNLPASDIPNVTPAMRRLIVETLTESIRFPVAQQQGQRRGVLAPRPYGDLVTLMERMEARGFGPVSFLTFNYDLGLDYALHRARHHVNYCFPSDGRDGVEVMKLHGSLNWTRCRKCSQIAPWHLEAFFPQFNWRFVNLELPTEHPDVTLNVGEHFSQFLHCSEPCAPDPILVPPTWNKLGYHEITSMWERAALHLSEAENIIIIGFSLPPTDEFFRFLFALGSMGEARIEHFVVFDPNPGGEIEQRFRALVGPLSTQRFQFRRTGFDEAIRDLAQMFGLEGVQRE